MIPYVECLGGEGAGPVVTSRCWNGGADEEQDELLPRKMAALKPKTEGSLRRRLLSAKIHQHHDAILGLSAGGACGLATPTGERKPPPPHNQSPGTSPWYRRQHPPPHSQPSLAPETHGKPNQLTPPPLQLPRSTYPVLPPRGRTGSCPPNPEPRPGYTLPGPSRFGEQEVPSQYQYRPSGRRRAGLFCFTSQRGRSCGPEATQATPLLHRAGEPDSKWSVHYTTQKPQRGLLFIPANDLQGQNSPGSSLSACSVLTQHCCSRPHSPPSPPPFPRRGWKDKSRRMSSAFSEEDEHFVLTNTQPLTPLLLNHAHSAACWEVFGSAGEPTANRDAEQLVDQEVEQKIPRLPTPEERMRKQAETVAADIVPINISGESFDRQASFRKVASNTDTLSRRPCNLNRHKTVTGILDDVIRDLDTPLESAVLPEQFSTVGQPAASSSSCTWERSLKVTEEGPSLVRRIRAPRSGGLSSLMASLTSGPPVDSSSELHGLVVASALTSEASFRTHSASSTCIQDLHGFPSDLQPMVALNPKARVIPQAPCSSSCSFPCSFPCSPTSSCLTTTPSRAPELEESHLSDRSQNEAYPSSSSYCLSSSIPQSQFSLQAPDDQIPPWQDPRDFQAGQNHQASSSLSVTSSSPVRWEGRSHSTSFPCSRSAGRRISLRKSTRPPPPPLRSDSLRRRPGRVKPPRSSSSCPRLERSPPNDPIMRYGLSPKTFHDPWVHRGNSKRRQSGFNCGTVTTFEPLIPDCQTDTAECPPLSPAQSQDHITMSLPSSPAHSHSHSPTPPGSDEEGIRFTPNPSPASSSVAELQRLTSPSSGYSTQSNTPTPGTPISSPLYPPSPRAFSPPPVYTSVCRTTSRGEGKPKPPVPLRKSSLVSPLSSSFSSTSSLSLSCTSLDSSSKRPLPPPLPQCSSPLPPVFSSHIRKCPPPAPPLPQASLPANSFTKLFASPLPSSSSHRPLPPPPPLPPSSLPLPPLPPPPPPSSFTPPYFLPSSLPLPPPPPPPCLSLRPPPPHFIPSSIPLPPSPSLSLPPSPPPPLPPSSRPPPPPYSYAIRQTSHSDLSSSTNFPPPLLPPVSELSALPLAELSPLPAPPPLPPVPYPPLNAPSSRCHPLITPQALQGIRLRSVKNCQGPHTSAMLTHTTQPRSAIANPGNASNASTVHAPPGREAFPDSAVLANVAFGSSKASPLIDNANAILASHCNYYSQTYSDNTQGFPASTALRRPSVPRPINDKTQSIGYDEPERMESIIYASLLSPEKKQKNSTTQHSSLQEQITAPVFVDAVLAEAMRKPGNADAAYWTFSGTSEQDGTLLLESREASIEWSDDSTSFSEMILSNGVSGTVRPVGLHPQEKPTLLRKPEQCVFGRGQRICGQITPSSPRLICQSRLPADSFCSPLTCPTCPPQHLVHTALPVNTTPDDISTRPPVSSPRRQKPPVLNKKPSLSPKTLKQLSGIPCLTDTARSTRTMGTLKYPGTPGTTETSSTLEGIGIYGSGGSLETSSTMGTMGIYGKRSEKNSTLGITDPWIINTIPHQEAEALLYTSLMRSLLAGDKDEKETVDERGMESPMMMTIISTRKKKAKRRRSSGRPLLMISSPRPSSSSSSTPTSSASSSGDEGDVNERTRWSTRTMARNPKSSRAVIGWSKSSPQKHLGTGGSLRDLQIHEEKETERGNKETEKSKEAGEDHMFESSPIQTTEDLFKVIHRSKRKMFGRRDSEENRHPTPSLTTPRPPLPRPTAAPRGQRSDKNESFKLLLLRKGSRWDSSSRKSAVERLCKLASSETPAVLQRATPTSMTSSMMSQMTLPASFPQSLLLPPLPPERHPDDGHL
ncbi:mucin-2-like isoform X2 [Pungitius pungitius]|uniref:mucin-2-like isoform X2 n=1 Tax=Pungitius pungitius TaxID=134920 RepID=UPI002E0EEACE